MTTDTRETTTDERIALRLSELTAQLNALQDPATVPLSWTHEQLVGLKLQRDEIDLRIAAIQRAAATRARLGTDEADQQWVANQTIWRATLSADLLTIKSPIRDKATMERARDLAFSIKLIDFGFGVYTLGPIVTLAPTRLGPLMAEAGYATSGPELRGPRGWLGSIPEVEQRIKILAKQRSAAEAALAETLIDDDARAARDAKHDEYRKALKTMRTTSGPDGRSLVAFTLDDEVLNVSDMTPLQREAFEWFAAVACPVSMA